MAALYKPGETVWVNPKHWEEAVVVKVETVAGPLGSDTFAYTLRAPSGPLSHYEMTIKNFQWLWTQAEASDTAR
tara:strand:- start:103 stop:324 length:222 start_codon:yes stop_codon:yes gene_type:complete